jgi:membrane associated rhomboid family serine protease
MTQPPPADPGESAVAVPHCYRHGDRETYISCQRCGRPICPDCMRQAAVGFQCPECVAEGARSVRPARTYVGGLVPARPGAVSMALIAINVAVFLLILATGRGDSQITLQGGLIGDLPSRFGITTVSDGAYWRLLSAAFIHVSVLHILFNMYALGIFGPLLEQLLGRLRFVALYVTGALVASVVVYWLAPGSFTIGASGAIFALFGAAIVLLLRRGQDVSNLLLLLALNVVITFAVPGISWQGHLGGLAGGLLFGVVFGYAPRRRRTAVHVTAFAVVLVVLVVATVARTATLTG